MESSKGDANGAPAIQPVVTCPSGTRSVDRHQPVSLGQITDGGDAAVADRGQLRNQQLGGNVHAAQRDAAGLDPDAGLLSLLIVPWTSDTDRWSA